jgi:hypothetical protein
MEVFYFTGLLAGQRIARGQADGGAQRALSAHPPTRSRTYVSDVRGFVLDNYIHAAKFMKLSIRCITWQICLYPRPFTWGLWIQLNNLKTVGSMHNPLLTHVRLLSSDFDTKMKISHESTRELCIGAGFSS